MFIFGTKQFSLNFELFSCHHEIVFPKGHPIKSTKHHFYNQFDRARTATSGYYVHIVEKSIYIVISGA